MTVWISGSGCWSGSRRGLERHHTLRHAVAWSYDLLDDTEKALLDRCSVFAGGFDLQSACAVAGSDDLDDYAILDLLDALVRKSLLVADRSSGRTRFSMLETIRQFAEEQLVASGVAAEVRTAHARYFAGREADILALWDSPRQRDAYDWFTVELANLRTAFRWAADQGDLDAAATIATYAGLLGAAVQTLEPIAWAEELIEPARAVDHPRLASLYVIASLCWFAGRFEAAVGYCDAGQIVLGRSRDALPYGIEAWLGVVYLVIGQPERLAEWCRAQLVRRRDTHVQIRSWLVLALSMAGSGGEAMDCADGLIEARAWRGPATGRKGFGSHHSRPCPASTRIPVAGRPSSRSAPSRREYSPSASFSITCPYPQFRPRNSHRASTKYTTSRAGSSRRRSSRAPAESTASSTSSGVKTLVRTPIEIRSGSHPTGAVFHHHEPQNGYSTTSSLKARPLGGPPNGRARRGGPAPRSGAA